MEPEFLKSLIKKNFPLFLQTSLVEKIIEYGQVFALPQGGVLLEVGDIVKVVPLILAGNIKVVREDEQGNEIFLYYIQPGESCAMTLSSCLKREKSEIRAVVQTPIQGIAIPVDKVYDLIRQYPGWNDFMVNTYSNRFGEILEVVDQIAFNKLDVRLLKYLLDKAKVLGQSTISISKTDIARDLNSSREVISRLLKQMVRKDIIAMQGNDITILDN